MYLFLHKQLNPNVNVKKGKKIGILTQCPQYIQYSFILCPNTFPHYHNHNQNQNCINIIAIYLFLIKRPNPIINVKKERKNQYSRCLIKGDGLVNELLVKW